MTQPFTALEQIVRNGFCIGCGLCAWAAPGAEIEMRPNEDGHLRPVPARPPSADEMQKILTLCPGVSVTHRRADGAEDQNSRHDPVWGTLLRVVRGHATHPDVRFRASSGGVMTAVNRHLLRTGEVAFVLQVIPDPHQPFGSLAAMCRSEAQLDATGGSRYGSCASLLSLPDALALGEPFAVSLKPCDIAAIQNLKAHDPRARALIRFTQAMFCGSVPSFSSTRGFFQQRGVDLNAQQPVSFRWRGEGCPGPTRAVMPDGTVLQGTYAEMWVDNPWSTQFRCKVCPDSIGLQADLAVGDDWEGGAPEAEDDGWNAAIAHTATGLRILNACESEGSLRLYDADVARLDAVQPHQVRLRRHLAARLAACTTAGLPTPAFTGLQIEDCAREVAAEALGREYAGTLARLRAGHGDEAQAADYGAADDSAEGVTEDAAEEAAKDAAKDA